MNSDEIETFKNLQIHPLHDACSHRNVTAVKQLIHKGANVNVLDKNEYTPLHHVCFWNYFEIARLLIEHGADVNISTKKFKTTPLHFACLYAEKKNSSIVELLLKNNANVNAQNFEENTPLHFAVQKEYIEIVKLLLSVDGIDAFHKNIYGQTPLDLVSPYLKEEFHLLFYPPVLYTKSAKKLQNFNQSEDQE